MKSLRRKDKELPEDKAVSILKNGEYGVLSTADKEGRPYGIPLNYIFQDHRIYFHCAKEGHKIDNIADCPAVSFCVVGSSQVIPEKFTSHFKSVIVFGTASVAEGEERQNALTKLVEKYCPDHMEEGRQYIQDKNGPTKVIKIEVTHISGKVSPPLT